MSAAPLCIHLEQEEKEHLAIRTGVRTGTFAVTRLVSQERDAGWVIHGSGMKPWHIEGFIHQQGVLYFFGPALRVTPFQELLFTPAAAPGRLQATIQVYRAIRRLEEAGVELPAISLTGLFLTDDGGVLIAPPKIVENSLTHLTEEEVLNALERHTHPDLPRDRRDALALGVWVYRILTGAWPFPGENIQELRGNFRAIPPRPPRAVRPALSKGLTETLEALLSNPTPEAAERVIRFIEAGDSLETPLSQGDEEAVRAAEERRYNEGSRRLRQRRYLGRNWRRLILIAAIILVVLSVPFSIVRRALEPSPLEGKSVTEVTRAFYYAMNEFDHPLMEEAVIDKAAEDKLREVTNLYIFSRMQGAMEGSSRFVDAQEWREAGMPELRKGHHPYGVAKLRILSARQEGNDATVRVRYEKWEPTTDREEGEEGGAVPLEEATEGSRPALDQHLLFLVEERLLLTYEKEQWFIREVETLERERRDPQGLLEETGDQ